MFAEHYNILNTVRLTLSAKIIQNPQLPASSDTAQWRERASNNRQMGVLFVCTSFPPRLRRVRGWWHVRPLTADDLLQRAPARLGGGICPLPADGTGTATTQSS